MWRLLSSVAEFAAGVTGVYWLMVWDTHFFMLALFGCGCGGISGAIPWGRRGCIVGVVVGFIIPLAYLPLWFIFNLPPGTGIDL